MRVGIDARMLSMGGVGTYLRSLLAGLARCGAGAEYVVFTGARDAGLCADLCPDFRLVPCAARPYSFVEQAWFPRLVERERLDLIHHPHYFAPWFGATPVVATVHDMIHQLFPAFCPSPLHWRVSKRMLARTARRARMLLAVSAHTKNDLVTRGGIEPQKIRVTRNALPPDWAAGRAPAPRGLEQVGDAPFFLYVGNRKPHKNLGVLLEAFAGLARAAPGVRLVMTGERENLTEHLRLLRLGEEVVFLGSVSPEALPAVYRAALALVLPSRYEGFGYPALEAMACGTPPIVSDAASLPEVVGEAGLVVPVNDVDALRTAMLRLLERPGLGESLSEKARRRARLFRWEQLATQTQRAYRDALRVPRGEGVALPGEREAGRCG